MSQLTEKQLQLLAAMVKNFNGDICASVNWDQAALDSGYQDAKNAKTMWGHLSKKFAETAPAPAPATATAHASNGDDENAGEASTTTAKATTTKKRKAAGTPQADSSSTKVAQNGHPTKKAKGSGGLVDKLNAENEAAAANLKTEDHSSEAEASIEQQGDEEAA